MPGLNTKDNLRQSLANFYVCSGTTGTTGFVPSSESSEKMCQISFMWGMKAILGYQLDCIWHELWSRNGGHNSERFSTWSEVGEYTFILDLWDRKILLTFDPDLDRGRQAFNPNLEAWIHTLNMDHVFCWTSI